MDELTPKQEEVMRLMARGLTNGQIAERMGVTLAGAKWHVSEVLSKLGVASREEAVAAWQAEHGTTSRLRGLAGVLFGTKAAIAGATAAGVAGVFVVASLVTGGGADGDDGEVGKAGRFGTFLAEPRERYYYGGECDEWSEPPLTRTMLCKSIVDNEARFTVAFREARVTVDGVAGARVDRFAMTLEDGTIVETVTGPFVRDATDPGRAFNIDATFHAAPKAMTWLTWDRVVLGQADLSAIPETDSWPEATPAPELSRAGFEQKLTGACMEWRFPSEKIDQCVTGVPTATSEQSSGDYGDGFLVVGSTFADAERVVVGFDDGTLREALLTRAEISSTEREPFQFFALLAEKDRAMLSLTTIQVDGDATVERFPRYAPEAFQDPWASGHVLQFADGEVAITADADGCYGFVVLAVPAGGPRSSSGSCRRDGDGLYGRAQDEHLSVGMFVTEPDLLVLWAVTTPEVHVVEIVDADGNVYREGAQVIPSSPQGLKFVYFDREVAAPARDVRALDAAGNVLEMQTGVLGDGG